MEIFSAVDDPKVRRAVERTLTIWEERNVYSEEFIAQLRTHLQEKEPEEPAVSTPVATPTTTTATPKVSAAQKSKIVAEFVPQGFIQKLQKHRSSVDEVDLREKQLAAMRVDVCSSEALKKLKDKAGGKKFAKDFEEGSAKLQEFVSILEGQVKKGPVLLEALQNADVFYEMQYKEVKIVTKAYETFANRVSHLKRKLDALKAGLPSLDDSPVPSPCADAPSPTGSESPFRGLASADLELDAAAMADQYPEPLISLGDVPSPLSSPGGSPKPAVEVGQSDNREVEDMEMSDGEEAEGGGIIAVEEPVETPTVPVVSNPAPAPAVTQPAVANEAASVKQATPSPETAAAATAVAPSATPAVPANLASVDLGKISSILSSIMKNTGGARPSTDSPVAPTTTPAPPLQSSAPPPQSPASLASILSKVDTSTILSALSKTQGQAGGLQGFSSILNAEGMKTRQNPPASTERPNVSFPAPSKDTILTAIKKTSSLTPSLIGKQETVPSSFMPKRASSDKQATPAPEKTGMQEPAAPSKLDSRLLNFFQGREGLHAFGLDLSSDPLGQRGQGSAPTAPSGQVAVSNSPALGQENLEGTPVRDESGGTPTQDEATDASMNVLAMFQGGAPKTPVSNPASTASSSHPAPAYDNEFWRNSNVPSSSYTTPNGRQFHQVDYNGMGKVGGPPNSATALDQYKAPVPNTVPGAGLPPDSQMGPVESRLDPNMAEGSWYDQQYMDQHGDSNVASTSLNYEKDRRDAERHHQSTSLPLTNFFTAPLPPIPQLPPPPKDLLAGPSSSRLDREPLAEPPKISSRPEEYNDPPPFEPVREDLLLPYPEHEEEMGHPDEPPYPYPHPHHRPLGPELDPRHPLHYPRSPPHHLPRRALSPPPGPMGDYYDSHSPPPRPVRPGYYDDRSPSPPPFEDPYYDRYYDREARSPSPPPYPYRRPLSPHSLPPDYDPYDLPPPQHRHPPHPFHPCPPRPMHPVDPMPQRPLGPRRPMPPRPPHHPHDPYRMPMKRPGPPFGGHPRVGGPFYPPKRPFLPPRY
ncbi:hypothetical protein ACEWY4_023748 [Coilia grayii]|uniref:CID domain-containing protein n=1 Tax=Coilia grayii TaxID=363190 RepID=A0ABD1IYC9_9TELE